MAAEPRERRITGLKMSSKPMDLGYLPNILPHITGEVYSIELRGPADIRDLKGSRARFFDHAKKFLQHISEGNPHITEPSFREAHGYSLLNIEGRPNLLNIVHTTLGGRRLDIVNLKLKKVMEEAGEKEAPMEHVLRVEMPFLNYFVGAPDTRASEALTHLRNIAEGGTVTAKPVAIPRIARAQVPEAPRPPQARRDEPTRFSVVRRTGAVPKERVPTEIPSGVPRSILDMGKERINRFGHISQINSVMEQMEDLPNNIATTVTAIKGYLDKAADPRNNPEERNEALNMANTLFESDSYQYQIDHMINRMKTTFRELLDEKGALPTHARAAMQSLVELDRIREENSRALENRIKREGLSDPKTQEDARKLGDLKAALLTEGFKIALGLRGLGKTPGAAS
ncbi:MAG: hypothetical protein JW834_00455 [Candidatus Diapherotrites archaeon]|nr:hypothetical protein [Candidatus Diapherotrites archaeon]